MILILVKKSQEKDIGAMHLAMQRQLFYAC